MTFSVVLLALAAARVQEESPFRPVPAEAARPLTEAAIQAELTRRARLGDADGAIEMRAELRKLRFPRAIWDAPPEPPAGAGDRRDLVREVQLRALRARAERERGQSRAGMLPTNGVLADPGDYNPGPRDIGKTFRVRLGATRPGGIGIAYGTDVYTGGSGLRAAAEHAGAIGKGEVGVVKVTVLPGQDDYPGTSRNGVASRPWGRWSISFRVERD